MIQLEENLLAHPLALFPNLEQGINPDLYEEIGKKSFILISAQSGLKVRSFQFSFQWTFWILICLI